MLEANRMEDSGGASKFKTGVTGGPTLALPNMFGWVRPMVFKHLSVNALEQECT